MKKEQKFETVEEAYEFLRNLKSFFFKGDSYKLKDEEIILLANDINEINF